MSAVSSASARRPRPDSVAVTCPRLYVEGGVRPASSSCSCDDEAVLVAVAAAGVKAGIMLYEVRRGAGRLRRRPARGHAGGRDPRPARRARRTGGAGRRRARPRRRRGRLPRPRPRCSSAAHLPPEVVADDVPETVPRWFVAGRSTRPTWTRPRRPLTRSPISAPEPHPRAGAAGRPHLPARRSGAAVEPAADDEPPTCVGRRGARRSRRVPGDEGASPAEPALVAHSGRAPHVSGPRPRRPTPARHPGGVPAP